MIVGTRERFAIEAIPRGGTGQWIYGSFAFWIAADRVGDWEDATHLRGCSNWLATFGTQTVDRFEPRFENLPAREVIRLVWDLNLRRQPREIGVDERLRAPFERFSISHLGMSSFDALDITLLTTSNGSERLLWRDVRDGRVGEVILEHGEMERVAVEASARLREELAAFAE